MKVNPTTLSRAERRRLERDGHKIPPITMVKEALIHDELEKKAKLIAQIATKETVSVMANITAYVLNIECGFGAKRIKKVMDRVRLQFECIAAGTLLGEDIIQYLEERNINVEKSDAAPS